MADSGKKLVAYFSATGTTEGLAQKVAKVAGAEIFKISPVKKYSPADLDWNDQSSRSTLEQRDPSSRPEIINKVPDMASYDTILLGFPIWWYEAPRIISTFLESYDFTGKTVIPFATSGGSGMGDTSSILQGVCPAAKVVEGRRFSGAAEKGELERWLRSLGV